jgi:hypothetical protein
MEYPDRLKKLITDCGRVFHKWTILLVKENFLKFILQNFFSWFSYYDP